MNIVESNEIKETSNNTTTVLSTINNNTTTLSSTINNESAQFTQQPYKQGAEARLYHVKFLDKDTIVKERFSKKYRHPTLDLKLTRQRTNTEVRCMTKCRGVGIDTPTLYLVDKINNRIYMEYVNGMTVRDYLVPRDISSESEKATIQDLSHRIGHAVATMHNGGVIHGDLTTSNMLLRHPSNTLVVIDFGLSFISTLSEDKAVDLYVLERALISTHPHSQIMYDYIIEGYQKASKDAKGILHKLEDVRARGRKRTMVG